MAPLKHPRPPTSCDPFPRRHPTLQLQEPEYQRYKDARDAALETLSDRRDKTWRIFSWTSSILIAVTGGAIALFDLEEPAYNLIPQGAAIIFAVGVLSVYACIWLIQNKQLAANAGRIVGYYDEKLGFDTGFQRDTIQVTYVRVVTLLTLGAVAAILFTAKLPEGSRLAVLTFQVLLVVTLVLWAAQYYATWDAHRHRPKSQSPVK